MSAHTTDRSIISRLLNPAQGNHETDRIFNELQDTRKLLMAANERNAELEEENKRLTEGIEAVRKKVREEP